MYSYSISLISYASRLGLSPLAGNLGKNSLFKCASQPEIAKNLLKFRYFVFQGRSKIMDVETPRKLVSSSCYDKQQL